MTLRSLVLLVVALLLLGLVLLSGAGGMSGEVVWMLRLPRALAGFAAGGLLALCAWALQALFRNSLVEPYVLGTSGGAALGGLLCLAIWGRTSLPGSWAGAAVMTLLLFAVSRKLLGRHLEGASARLLLAGVMLASITSAFISLALVSLPDRQLRGAVFWLLGDLSSVLSSAPLLVTSFVVLLWALWRKRDVLRLQWGEREAFLSGSSATRLRWEIPLVSAIAVGLCVSEVGAIGFIGLVAPQAVRYLGGTLAKDQVVNTWLVGGIFLMMTDWLARSLLPPTELPVGAVSALVGAPLFILLLLRGKR